MKFQDEEYERVYWTRPGVMRIFGNGLGIRDAPDDPWPFFDDRLLPQETFLNFNQDFIQACVDDSVDSMGTYCMGWQV